MFHYHHWGKQTLPVLDNMALEEYFLRESAKSKRAHLRFYDFEKDSVVVGYGQALDAIKKWDAPVARRASGGSHVQVGQNSVAYSVIVPRIGSFTDMEDFRAYYARHIGNTLESMGIDNIQVDNEASTVMTNNRVIASHAITWGVKSALLHGLLMIDPYDVDQLMDRVRLNERKIGSKTYTEESALRKIPTVTQELPDKPHASPVQRTAFFKHVFTETMRDQVAGRDCTNAHLSKNILQRARQVQENKYFKEQWLQQRSPTFSPQDIETVPGHELDGPLEEGQGYCLYIQVKDKDFKKMALPKE